MKSIVKYFNATFYWRPTDGTRLSSSSIVLQHSIQHCACLQSRKIQVDVREFDKQHNSGGCYYHYQYHLFLNLLNQRIRGLHFPLYFTNIPNGLTYCIYVFTRSIATGLKFLEILKRSSTKMYWDKVQVEVDVCELVLLCIVPRSYQSLYSVFLVKHVDQQSQISYKAGKKGLEWCKMFHQTGCWLFEIKSLGFYLRLI